ncbi:MAG: hypothetical protein EPN48_11180 [Microbacteriaceae bacterium]|nr:MAG: hypothetical protein EPN48_11180 [Microbacteriaceae bacterium]
MSSWRPCARDWGRPSNERDDVNARAETTATARTEAEERARRAIVRADDTAARALRAESDLAKVREQLKQTRTDRDAIREEARCLRGNLATVIAERDTARADARRERTRGDQRVSDLRTAHQQQLALLHDMAAELRLTSRWAD